MYTLFFISLEMTIFRFQVLVLPRFYAHNSANNYIHTLRSIFMPKNNLKKEIKGGN